MFASSLRMRAPMASRTACCTSSFMACPVVAPVRTAAAPVRTMTVVVEAASKQKGGKLKTKKAAAKRFKITATGKLMARQAGKQHFNEKKTRCDTLALSGTFAIFAGDIYKAKKCLPNSGIGK